MAVPTVPTLVTLTTEALKKCGYSSPSSAQLSRAQDYFVEEIKADIWILGKRLKCLQAEHVEVLAGGQSQYDFPSGFSSFESARVLYGDEADDVEGATASTVTLDSSDEDEGEDELEGKNVLIYSGTGKGSMSQIKSFDEDTYIATVYPAWANAIGGTAPVATDTYVTIDQITPLEIKTVPHFDRLAQPHETGRPRDLYHHGDEDHYGYYTLFPTPDEDYYYGVHLKYYLNLLTLDLASTRMATLYARWRNLWIQGVKAKQLEDDDDARAAIEMTRYFNMVKDVVALETYGRNIKPHYTGVSA